MAKFSAMTCESAKPDKSCDRLLGDGDGLFLRVRPHHFNINTRADHVDLLMIKAFFVAFVEAHNLEIA